MSASLQEKSKKTVLIVDDEASVLQVLVWALEDAGYRTQVAGDGQEAIALLSQIPMEIDVVISDVQMPRATGVDLLKFIATMENAPQIVMMSSHSDLNYAQAKAMGASTLVSKPFSIDVLLTALKEACANKKVS